MDYHNGRVQQIIFFFKAKQNNELLGKTGTKTVNHQQKK